MKMKPVPTEALALAQHEVGHWTVAKALGFNAGDIALCVYPMGGRAGHSVISLNEDLTQSNNLASHIENRIQFLFSGLISEAEKNGAKNNEQIALYAKTGGALLHAPIRELLLLLRNIKFGYCEEDLANSQVQSLSDSIFNSSRMQNENNNELKLAESSDEDSATAVDSEVVLKYLSRRIKVLYAGALAESLQIGVVNFDEAAECFEKSAANDAVKIEELVALLYEFTNHSSVNNFEIKSIDDLKEGLWNDTAKIVEEESDMISGLGGRLADDIVECGKLYEFSGDYLNNLPNVVLRFGN